MTKPQPHTPPKRKDPRLVPSNMVDKLKGKYDGAELQRMPGLTADRYEAFELPSRIGNWLYYRDGRKERVDAA